MLVSVGAPKFCTPDNVPWVKSNDKIWFCRASSLTSVYQVQVGRCWKERGVDAVDYRYQVQEYYLRFTTHVVLLCVGSHRLSYPRSLQHPLKNEGIWRRFVSLKIGSYQGNNMVRAISFYNHTYYIPLLFCFWLYNPYNQKEVHIFMLSVSQMVLAFCK